MTLLVNEELASCRKGRRRLEENRSLKIFYRYFCGERKQKDFYSRWYVVYSCLMDTVRESIQRTYLSESHFVTRIFPYRMSDYSV